MKRDSVSCQSGETVCSDTVGNAKSILLKLHCHPNKKVKSFFFLQKMRKSFLPVNSNANMRPSVVGLEKATWSRGIEYP